MLGNALKQCWQLTSLSITGTSTYAHVTGYMLRVVSEKAAKLVTTAQDCVLTLVSVKPLHTLKERSGPFPAVFLTTKNCSFIQEIGSSPAMFVATKGAILSQNMILSHPWPSVFVSKPNQSTSRADK